MCGLAGMFIPKNREPVDFDMDPVLDVIRHRGPDGDGRHVSDDRRYHAGFRRLSIIDPELSDQPLLSPDKSIVLLGNGEIYNYRELRQTEAVKDYPYQTKGDMEVILPLIANFGDDFVHHLNGMFALAVYDARQHQLTLVRDRIGIKPLYWAKTAKGGLIFASEIKSLLTSKQVECTVDETAVASYLAHGYVPAPKTLFGGIHKLPPGHMLKMDAEGQITLKRYWRPRPSTQTDATPEDRENRLLELLKDSLRLRLRSDVPLGVLLSGGIDSGLLVALAAGQIDRPLETYTVRFEGATYDESPLALQVAERYGTRHHVLDLPATGLSQQAVNMAWHMEEPMNDAALLPNFMIEQALGKDLRVALNGTGGDELFAGYGRYFKRPFEARYTKLPSFLRGGVLEPIIKTLSPMRAWQLARAEKFDQHRGAYLFDHTTYFPDPVLKQMQCPLSLSTPGPVTSFDAFQGDAQTGALIADLENYLPEDLLLLLDRSTMAASVEGRVPFLDHRLIEAALAVAPDHRTPDQTAKGLLKKLARPYLPTDILNAPKQGFASPVAAWMQSGLGAQARRLLCQPKTLERGWWTKTGIDRLLSDPHKNSFRIYSLMMLEISVRMFTEMPLSATPPDMALEDFIDG